MHLEILTAPGTAQVQLVQTYGARVTLATFSSGPKSKQLAEEYAAEVRNAKITTAPPTPAELAGTWREAGDKDQLSFVSIRRAVIDDLKQRNAAEVAAFMAEVAQQIYAKKPTAAVVSELKLVAEVLAK